MFVWPILFEAIQDILGIDETTLILGGAIAFFPVGIAFAFLVDLPAVKSFLETKILRTVGVIIGYILIIPVFILTIDFIVFAVYAVLSFDGPACTAFRGDCDY